MSLTTHYVSPIGIIQISAEEDALTEAVFVDGIAAIEPPKADILKEAVSQLDDYFKGRIKAFNLPLEPEGTEFQQQVWLAMRHIPFGHKKTYGDIAEDAGSPKGARAVGQACNKNPLLIFVPCHRVIGLNNPLDYGAGKKRKQWLIEHEGIEISH